MRKTGIEFISAGKLGVRDIGEPPMLRPTEILIETMYTGITNGTERHALLSEHGYGGSFPGRHGYQHVGKITAVGSDVVRYKTGDWVFYGGYVGHNGWNVSDEQGLLLGLPPKMKHKYCALFGTAGVALRSVRRMGVGPGDNIWVVGQGPIGHFVAQAARAAGARVTVTDLIDIRLAAAEKCGMYRVLNAGDENTERLLADGGPYNYIYDCCSSEDLLSDIYVNKMLAHGGTIALMAVRNMVNYPWSILHQTEGRIETSCHFTNDDLRVLLFLYQQGSIAVKQMVSHIVSIDRAPQIYDLLAHHGDEIYGVIFDWGATG